MRRNLVILSTLAAFCVTAYFSGRAYEHSRFTPAISVSPVSGLTESPANPPVDLGNVVYHDLARISFADLYETLRDATPPQRVEWLCDIEQTPEGPRKIAALCGFFRALVQADPRMAAELVIKLPRHRGPAMDAMISAAPPAAMPDLAEMLLKVPSAARNFGLTDHLGIVIDEWTQVDPDAVVRFFDQHEKLPQQYSHSFVQIWAGIDAEAARSWLDAHSQNLSEFDVESWLASWLTGWFSADPQAAINYAFTHVKDDKFSDAIVCLAPELFEQDQPSAKAFIERLPTTELRQEALNEVARLGSSFGSSEYPPSVVARFLLQFPSTEWPKRFSDVIGSWRYLEAAELLDWISRLPPTVQTEVVSQFPAPSIDEPEQDFLAVLRLSDSNLREKLLRQLVSKLASENQSVGEAVAKLNLSSEQKAELAACVAAEGFR